MSKLISGKEALMALANGEDVEYENSENNWFDVVNDVVSLDCFLKDHLKFRLKPRTIKINGIEVPPPFNPEYGDTVYLISDDHNRGYCSFKWKDFHSANFGAWRTEEEIKQVVAALRKVFEVQP